MKNTIKYEDTDYKSLGLVLIDNDVDVSELSIIDKISNDDVEFGILGASHYVKYKVNGRVFSEIFACKKLKGDNIRYYPLEKLTKMTTHTENFKYEFKVEVIDDIKRINKLISNFDNLLKSQPSETLKEVFPIKRNGYFEPATYVHVTSEENTIISTTIHAYPEDDIVVYTESKLNKINHEK